MEFIKSFVKRGRKLSQIKSDLLTSLLPKLTADPKKLLSIPKGTKINLEIGFGNGDFLYNIALKKRDEIFIGCEPYVRGVVAVLERIQNESIENILLWKEDARILIKEMPDNFLDNVFILFPDPWPKAKHHKRRIINKMLLDLLSAKMKKDSHLYIATDHQDYKEWIIETIDQHESYVENSDMSWKQDLFEDIETGYQRKASKKNISSSFMCFNLSK